MTLSLSEFHQSLRELDSLVSISLKWPERTEYANFIRIFAKNLATHALYMMGRRTCPVTGYHYFLDIEQFKNSIYLDLENATDAPNSQSKTDDPGGNESAEQHLPTVQSETKTTLHLCVREHTRNE